MLIFVHVYKVFFVSMSIRFCKLIAQQFYKVKKLQMHNMLKHIIIILSCLCTQI